ncbi:MAG: response regulator [Opitutales bacterium]|nr:response regulator [Opitutales bacterium]
MKKALVADDHGVNIELAIAVLETMGYEGHSAKNGKEAVEKADEILPDLVLLDYTMPVMDGVEACSKIRQIPALAEIPIFFLSANDELKDRHTAIRSGADDFLSKPFNEQTLKEALWVFENAPSRKARVSS